MPTLVPILHCQSFHYSNRLQCLRLCQYSCLTVPTVCVHSILYSEAALDFPPLLPCSSLVHMSTNKHPGIYLIQVNKSTFRLVVSTHRETHPSPVLNSTKAACNPRARILTTDTDRYLLFLSIPSINIPTLSSLSSCTCPQCIIYTTILPISGIRHKHFDFILRPHLPSYNAYVILA